MSSYRLSLIILIYLLSILPKTNSKFIDIKSLNSEKYFVVFDNGLYIYDNNFAKIKRLESFRTFSSNNLFIIKHIYQRNVYIICLISNYLYIYDETRDKFSFFQMNDIIGYELLKYSYYNIIPYNNNNNKLNLIISSIKEELKVERCEWYKYFIGCKDKCYYVYYNIYKDYNFYYNRYGLTYNSEKAKQFEVPSGLLRQKNICHILGYSLIIKCIYYDTVNFFALQYNISQDTFQKSNENTFFANFNFIKIASAKSDINYLICPLYVGKFSSFGRYNINFTNCQICDENKDYNKCDFVENLYEDECSNIKTYFFNEKNEFAFICKNFKEFILSIISQDTKKVIERKIIYINCTDNKGYEDEFSLIYNNSSENYQIITENNFTAELRCSFYEEENVNISSNNKTMSAPDMETGIEEIKENNTENIIKEESTNKTLDDFLRTNISEIMEGKDLYKNYEIKGDTFTVTIKPTNFPRLPNKTYVEFNECEKQLRGIYNISNTSIITFLQMEMKNEDNNALYNQIKYTTYDETLNELDLSVCKDIETQIHYFIKDDSNLNLDKVSDYQKMGVDILNINDDFFTNLCYAFSSDNNDMILEDRIKYIFQNYSLCEEGCSYNNLDIITKSISCDCKIQGNLSTATTPLIFDSGKETSFFDSNIGVSKCYNLVFSLNNKIKNIGFITFCILILIYLVAIFVQIKKGIKPVEDFIYNEMINYGYIEQDHYKFFENKKIENNKIGVSSLIGINKENKRHKKRKKLYKKKNKKDKKINSIKISQKVTLAEENEINKDTKFSSTLKMEKIKKKKIIENDYDENNFGIIKIKINSEKNRYHPKDSNQSLLNYTFDEAVRYDKRNIIRIFYIYLLSKQIFFRTFFQKSPLELFPIKLTLIIFMLSCDLALNALFYFNDNISKKYHYASNIFLFTFNNNLTIIIYSTLISYFILTLLSKLGNSSNAIRNIFIKEEEKIKKRKNYETKESTRKNIFNEIENILKYFKVKIFLLVLIETILILFFWYFVTAFCHVYSSTQTSWILDSFLAIFSRFVIEIIFGFLFAKLYRIAVASNCSTLYKILICIYDFS